MSVCVCVCIYVCVCPCLSHNSSIDVWHVNLTLLCLAVYLSACLTSSVCLCLSAWLTSSVCLCLCMYVWHRLSVYVFMTTFAYLYVSSLSVFQYIWISNWFSACTCVCLSSSVCLSLWRLLYVCIAYRSVFCLPVTLYLYVRLLVCVCLCVFGCMSVCPRLCVCLSSSEHMPLLGRLREQTLAFKDRVSFRPSKMEFLFARGIYRPVSLNLRGTYFALVLTWSRDDMSHRARNEGGGGSEAPA